jgi:diacylglycerol O-acyltransferase
VDTRRDVLGPEDIAILRLESPTIAGHCCKTLMLDPAPGQGRLTLAALREHLAERLAGVPRMTARLSDDTRVPTWEPDPRFDIRNHVRSWAQSRPATRTDLLGILAALMTTRLDRTRPLWSIHLVDLEDERSAIAIPRRSAASR